MTSPHSGTDYIQELVSQSRLPTARLRASEDSLVDQLIADMPTLGATTLCAHVPRVFCDLNRAAWELDPEMFIETLPGHCDNDTARVAQGYGTIARFASAGDSVYAHRLPFSEACHRIETYWQPFHTALKCELDQLHARSGACLLIDCHSMPRPHLDEVDMVFGDAFGTSCRPDWLCIAEQTAIEFGFRTARNSPYAGGYITRHYGRPALGFHAMQTETARPLYLQHGTHHAGRGFRRVKATFEAIVSRLVREV